VSAVASSSHTQTHKTHDTTRTTPETTTRRTTAPHLTTIEGGAATVHTDMAYDKKENVFGGSKAYCYFALRVARGNV